MTPKTPFGSIKREIITLLKIHGQVGFPFIVGKMPSYSSHAIRYHLSVMEEQGFVRKAGFGPSGSILWTLSSNVNDEHISITHKGQAWTIDQIASAMENGNGEFEEKIANTLFHVLAIARARKTSDNTAEMEEGLKDLKDILVAYREKARSLNTLMDTLLACGPLWELEVLSATYEQD